MRLFFIVFCCLISSQFVYSKSTNAFLNHADSLIREGKFVEAFEYISPKESEFNNETIINKYHYYGIISAWYLRQKDYLSAIPFLEKQAQFNQNRLEVFLYLANIFSTKKMFIDRNKAEYYARKALLIDDEANRFAYTKDYTNRDIGRLHYILGALAARSGNGIISKKHLNWINSNDCTVDSILINHLQSLIDSIQYQGQIISYDTIRPKSLRLIKASIDKDGVSLTSSLNLFKVDNEVYYEDIDSIASISDIAQYLRNVFYIEDRYTLDDINKSAYLLRKACEVSNMQEFYKKPSIELCELYMRLGRLDFILKQYDSAITWFLLSYTVSRKLNDGLWYNIQALGEISDIYLAKGENENSILYADEMLENIVNLVTKGNTYIGLLSYLSRYANVLSNSGYDLLAENFYKLIIDYAPKQSNAYNLACNNYATHLFLHNKRDEACYYYELIKDAYPTPQTISNLAIAYLVSDRKLDAEITFQEYYKKNMSLLVTVLKNFTEKEWEDYWKKNGYEFYISSNYLAPNIGTRESLISGYNACVLSKSLPLVYKIALNRVLSSSSDSVVKADYSKYIKFKRELSKSSLTSTEKGHVINELSGLEQSLIEQVNSNAIVLNKINDYNSVMSSLKEDEIAVEFCQYMDLLNPSNSNFGAYIICKKFSNPIFITIGNEIELSNMIFNARKDELSINELYKNSNIGDLIWGPILPYLKDKRRIYFSPVGELSLLNHQLLRIKDCVLGDSFEMRRVSSTSYISGDMDSHGCQFSDIALYGDINYDFTAKVVDAGNKRYHEVSTISSHTSCNNDTRDGWNRLQYSRQEVDSIKSIIHAYNLKCISYIGANASEEAFRALDYNSPSIIHVATHGFSYYRNNEEEKRNKIKSVSPYTSESVFMSWTGLLFAGANNHIKEPCIKNSINDGVLTAYDISTLHLDGSKLVVLSACNTANGICNDFGVTVGLQRAFKTAGVQSILMSLWQVPDDSTAILMTRFYEALFNGHNQYESLKIAMDKVKEIYPDPYYWGAFVILD